MSRDCDMGSWSKSNIFMKDEVVHPYRHSKRVIILGVSVQIMLMGVFFLGLSGSLFQPKSNSLEIILVYRPNASGASTHYEVTSSRYHYDFR
jgi:hypothetical protein